MNWRILLAILVTSFALAFTATPAQAQATRTWVSGVGDDANPCSRTAPCKTFAGAISKTAAGGEINCLDPGGYGAVTITKSITIDCTGTLGSALASSTTGVIVNGANIVVILRNIAIQGAPPNLPGVNGIRVLQGASVNIEHVRIQGFRAAAPNGFGVIINPTSGSVNVYISHTIISGNGTAVSGGGIGILPTGSAAVAVFLNNVELTTQFQGLVFNTTGTTSQAGALQIHDSVFFRNTGGGLVLTSGANAQNTMLDNVTLDANGTAIALSGAGVSARIGGSVITFNGTAVTQAGGANIQSFRDNQIDLNGNNSTPIAQIFPA